MSDVQDSAAHPPVTIEVPVQHADLFHRILDLIKRDEQWVLDNVHAGVTTLENILMDTTRDVEDAPKE